MTLNNEKRDSPQDQFISDTYKKYSSPLLGFISKRIPSKEDSEDILQNVFYQLSKIDLDENPIEQVSAWLYSVARNQIIDRKRKHKEVEMPFSSENDGSSEFIKELTEFILATDSPETEFVKTLIWEELDIALSELPIDQREIFELTELEGFSFKEISEATGVTVNTLISRKRYAVLHLRKRLFELYEDLLSS